MSSSSSDKLPPTIFDTMIEWLAVRARLNAAVAGGDRQIDDEWLAEGAHD